MEVSGLFKKGEALLILNFVWHSFSRDSHWVRVSVILIEGQALLIHNLFEI